jgi:hypothetical protein
MRMRPLLLQPKRLSRYPGESSASSFNLASKSGIRAFAGMTVFSVNR